MQYDPALLDERFNHEPADQSLSLVFTEIEATIRCAGQAIVTHGEITDPAVQNALDKLEEALYWGKRATRNQIKAGKQREASGRAFFGEH